MNRKLFPPKQFFSNLKKVTFHSRKNRFVVQIIGGKIKTFASLPNSGKLGELLIPGVKLLVHKPKAALPKYPFKVAGVSTGNETIMLDTHITNDVVEYLLRNNAVPGLKGAKIIKREFTSGKSRFDFLLQHKGKKVLCEVKSCTLFSGKIGMFPDAVTSRGSRHVHELAELTGRGFQSVVLFLVHSSNVTTFLPDFHTDIDFAYTLYAVRNRIKIIPLSIGWTQKLDLILPAKKLTIPWHIVKRDARDSGCYIIVLYQEKMKRVSIGKIGEREFIKGYYCYIGSAKKNLIKRIERHRRVRKNLHWHIDYLRNHSTFLTAYPIRTSENIECALAEGLILIAEGSVKGFGCGDCACQSHLFYFGEDPRFTREFQDILLDFRINRLQQELIS